MNTSDFQSKINLFNLHSSEISERLDRFQKLLANHMVPAKPDVLQLYEKLKELVSDYDGLFLAAIEFEVDDELQEGCSVDDIARAVLNSRAKRFEEIVGKAEAILGRFIRVNSDNEKCLKALLPYQEKARKLLSSISEASDIETAGQLLNSQEMVIPKLFLEGLDCEDFVASDECVALFEKLRDAFPEARQIPLGLSSKHFFDVPVEMGDGGNSGTAEAEKTDRADNVHSSVKSKDHSGLECTNEAEENVSHAVAYAASSEKIENRPADEEPYSSIGELSSTVVKQPKSGLNKSSQTQLSAHTAVASDSVVNVSAMRLSADSSDQETRLLNPDGNFAKNSIKESQTQKKSIVRFGQRYEPI